MKMTKNHNNSINQGLRFSAISASNIIVTNIISNITLYLFTLIGLRKYSNVNGAISDSIHKPIAKTTREDI
jgi:hypothetical protein